MDRLNNGESLAPGAQLTSPNGKYVLVLQNDGNLALTDGGSTVWASGTANEGGVRADMQADGNFALYNAAGEAVWSTKTDGNPSASIVLQDDRNLVIYASGGSALWSTKTDVEVPAAAEVTAAPAAAPAPAPRTYTVKKGDTLWAIAKKYYGDGKQYPKIAQASGIANPDLIHPGQQLVIPE